jgi:hypothetical protein
MTSFIFDWTTFGLCLTVKPPFRKDRNDPLGMHWIVIAQAGPFIFAWRSA